MGIFQIDSTRGLSQLSRAEIQGLTKEYLGRSPKRKVDYYAILGVAFVGTFLLLLLGFASLIPQFKSGTGWQPMAGGAFLVGTIVLPFVVTRIVRTLLLRQALRDWVLVNWEYGRSSKCYYCMYDLSESDGQLCPECGAGIPIINLDWFKKH